jgi:DNA-binding response OmpR family regulator
MAKILLVEDDQVYVVTVKTALEKKGFQVVVAEDGDKGFAVASSEKPDLIIIDIMLPKMDGITMAKKMKNFGISIPLIFLTNLGDVEHISEAIQVAQTDYLLKSDCTVEDIVDKVKRKLEKK